MTSRQRKLDAVVARLQLQYGPRAIRKAAAAPPAPVAHISTTFPDLDAALGIGGLPRGRITEIIGPATSGKVTLAAKVLSAAHREKEALVAWLDLSNSCDPDYLHRCGLDLDRLLIVRPRDAADALAIALHLVDSKALAALVFESLPISGPGPADLASIDPGDPDRFTGTVGGCGDVDRKRGHLPDRAARPIQNAGPRGNRALGHPPRTLDHPRAGCTGLRGAGGNRKT